MIPTMFLREGGNFCSARKYLTTITSVINYSSAKDNIRSDRFSQITLTGIVSTGSMASFKKFRVTGQPLRGYRQTVVKPTSAAKGETHPAVIEGKKTPVSLSILFFLHVVLLKRELSISLTFLQNPFAMSFDEQKGKLASFLSLLFGAELDGVDFTDSF